MSIPEKYIPKLLRPKDKTEQRKNIIKSRKLYKEGKYYKRPNVKSFKNRKSQHIKTANAMYKVEQISPNKQLSKKTHCSTKGLEKIVNKGKGAYYSSGSRPNQTAESWGIARLASAITGGKASIVDYHILKEHCQPNSRALKMAKETINKTKKIKNNMNKTKKNKK